MQFDLVCSVDGAWGPDPKGSFGGGISGNIKDKLGSLCYVFSGPCSTSISSEAELKAILHLVELWLKGCFISKKLVICSDSREAINLCKVGFFKGFPILVQNREVISIFRDHISLDYVPRELNSDADNLASNGLCKQALHSVWI